MKRNITVNIFGTLYPIDEDAYELLLKYNENMRRYYSKRDGGDEIADDVEHRVAELMSDYLSRGTMAITIEHVKEIIDRIGDPQSMDDHDEFSSSQSTENQDHTSKTENAANSSRFADQEPRQSGVGIGDQPGNDRKLFRDPEDKILGGVLSGISHYFGIKEPLILRIIMLVLFFASVSFVIPLYIIAWILIPEAVTPEDRLRMYGKPVSAKAINEEMMRGVNRANNFVNNPSTQDTARSIFAGIVKFILILIGLFIIFILGCILLGLLGAATGLSIASLFGEAHWVFDDPDLHILHQLWTSIPKGMLIVMAISAILLVVLPLYGIIRAVFVRQPEKRMPTWAKVSMVILWLICLFTLIASAIHLAIGQESEFKRILKETNTRNGIYLKGDGWDVLNRQGWSVEKLTGVDEDIVEGGIMPADNYGRYASLRVKENPNDMKYNLSQKRDLAPGTYKIDGYVRADGEGNALYVVNGRDTLRFEIPKYQENDNPISDGEVVVDGNNSRNLWTHVEGTFTVNESSNVKYGISNDNHFTHKPWNSQKIEIADIRIGQNI